MRYLHPANALFSCPHTKQRLMKLLSRLEDWITYTQGNNNLTPELQTSWSTNSSNAQTINTGYHSTVFCITTQPWSRLQSKAKNQNCSFAEQVKSQNPLKVVLTLVYRIICKETTNAHTRSKHISKQQSVTSKSRVSKPLVSILNSVIFIKHIYVAN